MLQFILQTQDESTDQQSQISRPYWHYWSACVYLATHLSDLTLFDCSHKQKNCIGKWCVPIQMSQCSCFQQRQHSSEVWRCKCVYVLLSMAKEASEGPRALLSHTGQEASHQPKHTDNCSPEHNHLLNTGLLRIAHSHRHWTEFMCAVCFGRDVSHEILRVNVDLVYFTVCKQCSTHLSFQRQHI